MPRLKLIHVDKRGPWCWMWNTPAKQCQNYACWSLGSFVPIHHQATHWNEDVLVVLKPEYSVMARSIPRLLASPGHQLLQYLLQDKTVLVFDVETFQLHASSKFPAMIENANILFVFLKINPAWSGLAFSQNHHLPDSKNFEILWSACMKCRRKICPNPLARLVVLLAPGCRAVGNGEPWWYGLNQSFLVWLLLEPVCKCLYA